MKESDIQSALVAYCRAVLPFCCVFAVPNAGPRTRSGRASNAVPGLMRGVSDLIVLTARNAIFAEVKRPGGKLRDEQREFGVAVQSLGFNWAVWSSIDDARNTFRALGIKTREAGE